MAFAVATLWPTATGKVFLGSENLLIATPWGTDSVTQVTNPWIGDTIDTVIPQTLAIRDGLLSGAVPQWNPYLAGGSPLGSLPNVGSFSPITFASNFVPVWLVPVTIKLLEIVTVSIGMGLFLRRLNVQVIGQSLASVAYLSCGFMIAWTNWTQTRVAAFIPLLFWAVDAAVVRRQWRYSAAVGAILAAMLLGGFPAVTGYAMYAVVAWGLLRLVFQRLSVIEFLKGLGTAALGCVLGLLLSAFQILPFVDEATYAINFESRRQTPDLHLDWSSLATVLAPGIFGEPKPGSWEVGWNPIEAFSFLGAVPVILACVALLGHRETQQFASIYFWALTAISCVAVYLGGGLLSLLQHLPIFSNNPTPRLRVIIGFSIAVLCGIGASWLWSTSRPLVSRWRESRAWTAAALILAVVVLGGLAFITWQSLSLAEEGQLGKARRAALEGAVFVGIGLIVVIVAATVASRVVTQTCAVALGCVAVTQAAMVTHNWWPFSPRDTFYPETPVHEYLEEHLGEDRYIGASSMMSGTGTVYRLRTVEGHSFHATTWRAALERVTPDVMLSPTFSGLRADTMADWADSPILDRLAGRYIVAPSASRVLGEIVDALPATGSTRTQPGRWYPMTLPPEPEGTAIRGVIPVLAAPSDGTCTLTIRDAQGAVLGSRTLSGSLPEGSAHQIALPDLVLEAGTVLEISSDTPISLASQGEDIAAGLMLVGEYDGVKVVQSGPLGVIYEREGALPRIRWSDRIVVDDSGTSNELDILEHLDPGQTLLEATGDGNIPMGDGTATLEIIDDSPGSIAVNVDATSDGWLTVMDALQRTGWHVAIDDRPVEWEVADVAGVAVYVPSGNHEVTFWYVAPGQRTGTWLSILGLALSAVIMIAPPARRLSRARRSETPEGERLGQVAVPASDDALR